MAGETKKEVIRTLKFIGFSTSAGVIELGTFTLLNELVGWPHWLCYLIALVLSVLWNFTLNRKFTFQSAGNVPKAMALVALFYLVFTPASTWLEHFLTGKGLNEYLVTGINMALNLSLEYLYDRFVVFRKTIDTNIVKKENDINNTTKEEENEHE
ncbi:MAG: GtrA family protein [Lachnospiraceae bacterium]|nr:GtrA family protein [Lachnospiraceae bacterium]MCR5429431.1 GtrA family protein [Lachnospiraceae bacterium]